MVKERELSEEALEALERLASGKPPVSGRAQWGAWYSKTRPALFARGLLDSAGVTKAGVALLQARHDKQQDMYERACLSRVAPFED